MKIRFPLRRDNRRQVRERAELIVATIRDAARTVKVELVDRPAGVFCACTDQECECMEVLEIAHSTGDRPCNFCMRGEHIP